jgi:hypothetical protein
MMPLREFLERLPLSAWIAAILAICLVAILHPALAQDSMRGPHPAEHDDPYGQARSIAGANCCHGRDCSEYFGPPPQRINKHGALGWQFGQWFFRDDQEIDLKTLRRDAWDTPSLCIGGSGEHQFPYCFHYPRAG